jgi:hypothetical protein
MILGDLLNRAHMECGKVAVVAMVYNTLFVVGVAIAFDYKTYQILL